MRFTLNPNDPVLNPSLWLGSFELREPVTTLTDFLVAITSACILIYFIKWKGNKTKNFNLYKIYFLCYTIGMTSAAWLGHGFQAYISPRWKMIGWIMSSIALVFFLSASINHLENRLNTKIIKGFKAFLVLKLIVFISLVIIPSTSSFKLVQIHSTIDIVGLALPLHFLNYKWNQSKGSLRIMIAIFYALIPGMIFSNQISVNHWFNYHDISHVMMAIFIFLMFRGAFELSTKQNSQTNN